MFDRYAIVPAPARGAAEQDAAAVVDAFDTELRIVRGNASLARLLLREVADAILPHWCEEVASTDATGTPRTAHILYGCEDNLRNRIRGWLAYPHWLRAGRDEFDVVLLKSTEPLGAGDMDAVTEPGAPEIGPQYAGDNKFTARMRFHQSWYRAHVLNAPCGTGPTPGTSRRLGSMLTASDAEVGLNFVSNNAFVAALDRLADDRGVVERFRLLHNLLSSQPMCFNLFGEMKGNLDLATRVWRELRVPWSIRRVTDVQFEYAPEPRVEYLDDHTAFDAFIEYECDDGSLGFFGIETKLTEPFSPRRYDGDNYRRWMRGDRAPWLRPDAPEVADVSCNQLWRDHLLAVALGDHPAGKKYSHGCLALVRHPLDEHCRRVAARYRELLKPGDTTFVELTVEEVVHAIEAVYGLLARPRWVRELRLRYLELAQSEGDWVRRRAPETGRGICGGGEAE